MKPSPLPIVMLVSLAALTTPAVRAQIPAIPPYQEFQPDFVSGTGEGITSMGPHPQNIWGAAGVQKSLTPVIYPEWKSWPSMKNAFNVRNYALTGFTVAGVMSNKLLIRAHLAQDLARSNLASPTSPSISRFTPNSL